MQLLRLSLIVTFLTFGSTNLFHSYTIQLLIFQIFVEFFVNAVEFVIGKLHFGFPVTVYTPAHAQVSKLVYFVHFLDFTMAGLALLLTGFYVLGVIKIYVIGQVMNANPFNGLCLFRYIF